METPDYLNYSRIEGKAKDDLNEEADTAHDLLMKVANAPEAAKRNLMETDFKVAVAMGNRIKAFLQAESANGMMIAVMADRLKVNADFIEANVPGLKKIKKLKA